MWLKKLCSFKKQQGFLNREFPSRIEFEKKKSRRKFSVVHILRTNSCTPQSHRVKRKTQIYYHLKISSIYLKGAKMSIKNYKLQAFKTVKGKKPIPKVSFCAENWTKIYFRFSFFFASDLCLFCISLLPCHWSELSGYKKAEREKIDKLSGNYSFLKQIHEILTSRKSCKFLSSHFLIFNMFWRWN